MRNKDIVVVSLQPWDIEIGSNCKNIAIQFARHNRVLYVNRALDRISSIKNREDARVQQRLKSLRGIIPDVQQREQNLWEFNPRVILESVNWMPRGPFRFFNRMNNRRLAKAIQDACHRLGFKDIILFIDNDFFRAYDLPKFLHPRFSIYYIRDYLIDQPYFKKHGPEMEQGLMKSVNIVVANSSYLANYARAYNTRAYDIGQGCDFSLFQQDYVYPIPDDMKKVSRPVIGYVGALASFRLDIALLVNIAKVKPQWSIVLIGPEDEEFTTSELHHLPNVHFLGRKQPESLPSYIYHFDVCINPQKVSKITLGNYPRKVDEYLALGKPVVATFTEFMQFFDGFVYLCANVNEYIQAIQQALEEKDAELKSKRISFALSHTWENSVKKLYDICRTM